MTRVEQEMQVDTITGTITAKVSMEELCETHDGQSAGRL